jgi:hypothetical protein
MPFIKNGALQKKKEKKKRIQRCTFNLTCIASMRKIQRGDAVETFW